MMSQEAGISANSHYTNWNSGEPNNADNNEFYMEMVASGQWNDIPGSNVYRYVTEFNRMQCNVI